MSGTRGKKNNGHANAKVTFHTRIVEVPLMHRRQIGMLIRSFRPIKEAMGPEVRLRIHWKEDEDCESKHPSVDFAYYLGVDGTVTVSSTSKKSTDDAAQKVQNEIMNLQHYN